MHTSREPVRLALRQLWSDHVMWTRGYIIDAVEGAALSSHVAEAAYTRIGDLATTLGAIELKSATDAAAIRLLKNQEDIGNAIVPYYGEAAGAGLTKLLKDHIVIAVSLVEDAKSGNQESFAQNDKKWDDNIREIARFLSGANPAWPEGDVYDLLNQHLQLTKGEVVARIQKNWAADVKAYDDIYAEAMVIADTLYDGLAAQFPDKFDTSSQKAAVGVA